MTGLDSYSGTPVPRAGRGPCQRAPEPSRSTEPRSCSSTWSRRTTRRPSASSPQLAGLPKSTTSRLVGALERQGLVQRDPSRRRDQPGAGAPALRAPGDAASRSRRARGRGARAARPRERRDGQPRRRDIDRGRDARPARQPPHRRLDELGRPSRASPRLGGRQGLPRRGRAADARPGRSSRSARARSPIWPSCAAISS